MKASGAQIIVKILENQGIKTVSGIPGGAVLPLYDELYKSSIQHVLVRHEQSAGFIAQGMARTSGLPAVCIATSGPGALNLLTAVADARCDSIPLIAITGQVKSSQIGTDAFQEADTFGLSFPITKHSVLVKSVQELLEVLPKAFEIASSGRPGPVLIDIPRDVQTQIAEFDQWPVVTNGQKKAQCYGSSGSLFDEYIEIATNLLAVSKNPVLYVGGGANSPTSSALIKEFLEIENMPVVTSLMGIGAVSCDNPLHIGMVGMHGFSSANRAMYESDVVFAVGAHFDDRATGLIEMFCPNAKIIHVDIDAAEVNKIYQVTVPLVCSIESVFPKIIASLKGKKEAINNDTFLLARKKWISYIQDLKKNDLFFNEVESFIHSIAQYTKDCGFSSSDVIVTTDVGQHQMWVARSYPITKSRQFLTSGSLGTMGFGLPAALGAALQNPKKRVICFTGDGSLMMNIQELATLAEENLNVTVIVFDNGTLGMVRQQQEILCEKRYSASIYKKSPDLCAIACGFGIKSVRVCDDGEWYKKAFSREPGPCFVYCSIEQSHMVFPFVPSGKANIEAITSLN